MLVTFSLTFTFLFDKIIVCLTSYHEFVAALYDIKLELGRIWSVELHHTLKRK